MKLIMFFVLAIFGMVPLAAQTQPQAEESSVNFRAGIITLVSRRNAILAGNVGKGDGLQPGFESEIWWPTFMGLADVGLHGRMLGGDFSRDSSAEATGSEAVGDVANVDIDLLVGRRFPHARVGLGVRRFSGVFRSVDRSFLRLGARSMSKLGTTDEFEVMLSGTVYLGVQGGAGGSGREAETRLIFSPQCGSGGGVASLVCGRTFVIAGYRFEQFTARAVSEVGGDQPEEIGSLVFGAGVKFP